MLPVLSFGGVVLAVFCVGSGVMFGVEATGVCFFLRVLLARPWAGYFVLRGLGC
jgi:hypothetical protein